MPSIAAVNPVSPSNYDHAETKTFSYCDLIQKIITSVAEFFTTIAKAIYEGMALVIDTLFCIEMDEIDREPIPERVQYPNLSPPPFNQFHPNNEDRQPALPPIASEISSLAQREARYLRREVLVPIRPSNLSDHSLWHGYSGSFDPDGWQELPPHLFANLSPVLSQPDLASSSSSSGSAAVASSQAPKFANSEVQQKQRGALARLNQIKEGLAQDPNQVQFDVFPSLLHFDCDKALSPYRMDTPIALLGEILNYGNYKYSRIPGIPTPERMECIAEDTKREMGLIKILISHATGIRDGTDFTGPKVNSAKESLSQLYNILQTKKTKASLGNYNKEELRTEIRWVFDKLTDAYTNCIDQINSQLEFILLTVVASELVESVGITKINIFGSHALFQYRANLLNEICAKQSREEPHAHVVDFERLAKNTLAKKLNLGSRITNTGAHYENDLVIPNKEERIKQALDEFLKLYNEKPRDNERPDQRPIAYLENGMIESVPSAPLEKFRIFLIKWIETYLKLETINQGLNYINKDVEAIVALASEDPENDFLVGGKLSPSGIKWLLETAQVTRAS